MGFNSIHYSDDEDDKYKHKCSYSDEWRYSMRMREKRQIFLRSYEFQLMNRKRKKKKKERRRSSVAHNMKTSLLKIKRVIWVRLNKLKLNINNHCFLPSPSRIRIRTTFFRLHIRQYFSLSLVSHHLYKNRGVYSILRLYMCLNIVNVLI